MKNLLGFILLGSLGYGGYMLLQGPCAQPIEYSVGIVSSEFGLHKGEFKQHIAEAEKVWETLVGKDLFQYKDEAKFTINLIYDERQKLVDQKQKDEFGLSAAESKFRTEDEIFRSLKEEYERRTIAHQRLVASFESASQDYEAEVAYWNKQGGAPPAEYAALQLKHKSLNNQVQTINRDVAEINALLSRVNTQLEVRNSVAESYNKFVSNYNQMYGSNLEFDQAEYVSKPRSINVYEFRNKNDLEIALAHELGHALGMDHVENQESILYPVAGSQTFVPTEEDKIELIKVCNSQPVLQFLDLF